MKLIVYFTESHAQMFNDYFRPSLRKSDNWDLIVGKGKQHSVNGNYFSKRFGDTVREKMAFLLHCLKGMEEGEISMFSDVDIVFLGEFRDYLESYTQFDMAFQNGGNRLNSGFFMIKNSPTTRRLIAGVVKNCHVCGHDQPVLNALIKNLNLNLTVFDSRVCSPSDFIFPRLWKGEVLNLRDDALVFHANWCAGVKNKIKLLDSIKDNFAQKKLVDDV